MREQTVTDVRTSRRFPVHLPLKVLSEQATAAGSTANISAAGAYLRLDSGLEVGSSAEFEITIPAESIGAAADVKLRCHGRVVRCDTIPEDGHAGVACMIESYEFIRAGEVGGE
jgi:hypothetical protein